MNNRYIEPEFRTGFTYSVFKVQSTRKYYPFVLAKEYDKSREYFRYDLLYRVFKAKTPKASQIVDNLIKF